MRSSWTVNDMLQVRRSMRFCVRPQERPRFCTAETKSRKTKQVKVCHTVRYAEGHETEKLTIV